MEVEEKKVSSRYDHYKARRSTWAHSSKLFSIMSKHKSEKFSLCGSAETVKHVLIYCPAYEHERVFLSEELREMGIANPIL